MNKIDCKIGMKVKMKDYLSASARRKNLKTGTVIGLYDSFALIKMYYGYNKCFAYDEITEIEEKEIETNEK